MQFSARPIRFARPRRRSQRPTPVSKPRLLWWRKHRMVTVAVLAALVAGLVAGVRAGASSLFPPPLNCGAGMVMAGSPPSCIGVNLSFGQFSAHDPAELRALESQIHSIDSKAGPYYLSVVLLLDLSPVSGIDTVDYQDQYPGIEGAITAAWQADNTNAYGTSPKMKLYLGNMGSQYRSWQGAVHQIVANRAVQHITSVVGLGQSTIQTRSAAALLGSTAHLPVIGSTVTGDSMNVSPFTHQRNVYFFRVSTPNSSEARGIAEYVSEDIHPKPADAVVVEDTPGDAYESTLAAVAPQALRQAGLTVYQPLEYRSGGQPPGESREAYLGNVFSQMQDNLCQLDPSLVFFAGRGEDLHAFVQAWADERGCQKAGAPPLRIVSGDDASAVVGDAVVRGAIQQGKVSLTYITLADPGMWNSTCTGAKANYDQFVAAFTGKGAACGAGARPGSPRFSAADLASGQAAPTHDAVLAALKAARDAQGNTPIQDQLVAVANPESQLNPLIDLHCTTMLGGANGYISFGPTGNPVDHPLPIVQLNGDGSVIFKDLTWPDGGPVVNLPARGAGCGPNG